MLRIVLVALALLSAALTANSAAAQSLYPLPPQPEALAWPTGAWSTAPLPRLASFIIMAWSSVEIRTWQGGPLLRVPRNT